ncbi:MAG: NADH-quinone oxidoreductase subunit NuoH [Phycisphaerae bacterium]|nr:NADH-quinone oxidoreductase subunit NuoH [Phycisphaerae bacterium]
MTQFTVPWQSRPATDYGFPGKAVATGVGLLVLAVVGYGVNRLLLGGHPAGTLFLAIAPALTGLLAFLALFIFSTWRTWGALLYRFALPILIVAVLGTGVLVYLVFVLCEWVTVDLVQATGGYAARTYFGGPLTLDAIQNGAPWMPGWLAVVIWPLQFALVRDVIALLALVGLFNIVPVFLIWWERKVAGRIQSRLGPMRVGGWHGWAQSFADGIKLVLKEDLIPGEADKPLFRLAPYLTIVPTMVAFLALPMGVTYVFRELDVALVFILGVLGVEVVGVIMAGWASNNKWSVYGAMREACQMVSYEIPMGMALLIPVLLAGTLNLSRIGEAQTGGWFSWLAFSNPFAFGGFVAYYVASLASCKRAPFDLPEAESELVAGFHTEYSGFRWALFFFAEYAAMFVVCGLAVILFLGGWNSPLPVAWAASVTESLGNNIFTRAINGLLFSGPVWFLVKTLFLLYVQIWLRWTLPRIRIDQVLYACVQVLLPLTMILLLGSTLWIWASEAGSSGWNIFDGVINVILGVVGMLFLAAFSIIAAWGFFHRRKLVGNLVVDPLPGG